MDDKSNTKFCDNPLVSEKAKSYFIIFFQLHFKKIFFLNLIFFSMSKKQRRRQEREKEFDSDSESDDEQVIPTKASAIRKGNILRIRGKPSKVLEMNTSAPGKHGAAKIHFVAIDLSNGKKIEDLHPAHQMVDVLEFKKREYTLSSIVDDEEGEVMILNPTSQGDSKEMKVPRGSNGKGIVDAYDKKTGVVVTVMTIHNSDYVSSFRLDRSRR